jgi:hypothetical protein
MYERDAEQPIALLLFARRPTPKATDVSALWLVRHAHEQTYNGALEAT